VDLSGKDAAAKSYLADSAKAWGGVDSPPPPAAAAVEIPPGKKFFSYEELKGALSALSCHFLACSNRRWVFRAAQHPRMGLTLRLRG
jgi:hypothetical protein